MFYYICRIGTGSYLVDHGIFVREKHDKIILAIEQAAAIQNKHKEEA